VKKTVKSDKEAVRRCFDQIKKKLHKLQALKPDFRYLIAYEKPKRNKIYHAASPEWKSWIKASLQELNELCAGSSDDEVRDEPYCDMINNCQPAPALPERSPEEMAATLLDGRKHRDGGISTAVLRRVLAALGRKEKKVGDLPEHMQRFHGMGVGPGIEVRGDQIRQNQC
jgi:hypothetical protein